MDENCRPSAQITIDLYPAHLTAFVSVVRFQSDTDNRLDTIYHRERHADQTEATQTYYHPDEFLEPVAQEHSLNGVLVVQGGIVAEAKGYSEEQLQRLTAEIGRLLSDAPCQLLRPISQEILWCDFYPSSFLDLNQLKNSLNKESVN